MDEVLICPICDRDLGEGIPDFCPTCAWDCRNDITLCLSLHEYSQAEREEYYTRFANAKQLWQKQRAEEEKLRTAEEEKDRKLKELAAKCSDLKTRICALTQDPRGADALILLDEYDKLNAGDKWVADHRRKIQEIQDSERREIGSKCSALRASINNSIQKQQWADALKLLDGFDTLSNGNSWSAEQRKLIQNRMLFRPTTKPVLASLPTSRPQPSNQDWVPNKQGSPYIRVFLAVGVVVIAAIVGFYSLREEQIGIPVNELSEVPELAPESDTTLTPKRSAKNANPSNKLLSFIDDFDDNRNNWNLKGSGSSYGRIQGGILKIVNDSSSKFVITKKTDFNFDNNWRLTFRIHNNQSSDRENVVGFAGKVNDSGEGNEYRVRMFGWHLNPQGEPTIAPFTIIEVVSQRLV